MNFSADILEDFLRTVYEGFDTSNEIEPRMWRELLRILNQAAAQGLADGRYRPRHNDDFLRAIKHNNEVFAAFKVHAMGEAMSSKLLDEKGNLKPFKQWLNDVKSISSHQVGAWLDTEYNTAVLRAHAAADWKEFERNKDVMPNLRWMPTTSPHAEKVHRAFWEKKLTLPVEHPFWAKHHPQDRWNCQCSLEATDDPASDDEVTKDLPEVRPHRGLENNPGKDGKLINDTHPYFPKNCGSCPFYKSRGINNRLKKVFNNRKKDCFDCPFIDGCIDRAKQVKSLLRERTKEIRKEAEYLKETPLINKDFKNEVFIHGAGIKEWLNQPHKYYREKNELLLRLVETFNKAQYLGPAMNKKLRPDVASNHIFEIELCGEKSWIIVHEMKWGEFKVHSISDSKNIKKHIQKE